MSEITRRLTELEHAAREGCPACGGDEIHLAPIQLETDENPAPSREYCPMCGRKQIVLGPIEFMRAGELREKSGGGWNLEKLNTDELLELRNITEKHDEY